jgi:hypothetical protein
MSPVVFRVWEPIGPHRPFRAGTLRSIVAVSIFGRYRWRLRPWKGNDCFWCWQRLNLCLKRRRCGGTASTCVLRVRPFCGIVQPTVAVWTSVWGGSGLGVGVHRAWQSRSMGAPGVGVHRAAHRLPPRAPIDLDCQARALELWVLRVANAAAALAVGGRGFGRVVPEVHAPVRASQRAITTRDFVIELAGVIICRWATPRHQALRRVCSCSPTASSTAPKRGEKMCGRMAHPKAQLKPRQTPAQGKAAPAQVR